MHQNGQKWLPSYRAITALSLLAAMIVTFAFIYFTVTFFLEEKAISRPPHPVTTGKDAFRVLINGDFSETSSSPIKSGLLPYLSRNLDQRVVPVQRGTSSGTSRVIKANGFDIALNLEPAGPAPTEAANVEPLLVASSQDKAGAVLWVSARKDLDQSAKQRTKKILLDMDKDDAGRRILSALGVDGFTTPAPDGTKQ